MVFMVDNKLSQVWAGLERARRVGRNFWFAMNLEFMQVGFSAVVTPVEGRITSCENLDREGWHGLRSICPAACPVDQAKSRPVSARHGPAHH